jgi:cutinase
MKSFTYALLPTLTFGALTSISQNDVTGGGGCKAMTVLFARGTTELGNMGSVAGPPFVSAIGAMMGGNVAVQGIEYPADVPGFLVGGDKAGSALMAKMVGQVRAKCPDTSLVMAGYSYVSSHHIGLFVYMILTSYQTGWPARTQCRGHAFRAGRGFRQQRSHLR